MQTFKLFVSSPGDVMVERRRVENVVSRLNGEFAGVARLEAIRWETEFYQAYSTFQAQIPRSTDCDLVIGILKWRLGTELPPDFDEKLPGGQPFPSGTAYEILTAIEKRRKGVQLPDIYLFRYAGSSPTVAVDDPNRLKIEHDWQALKGFFQEWFLTDRGHFKAAFNQYSSEDDFEAQLEKLLRHWVADKVAGGRVVRWPIEVKGSPFRGLAAFGAKHAPVFFGRSHDTARAVDLWREVGSRGSPYLMVVGASGSGKSSLARAGLVPRLTTPGVIKEVDAWRVAVMRPGDSPAGPFAALAAALMQDQAGLPKDEEGRNSALPEIGQGDSQTPAEFAAVLRHADAAAVKPIINALSRVAASEHDRDRYSREVRCDLVLLIDQFEELFAASVSEAERTGFIALVLALVETGRVWVAGTLRADFYARMLEQPSLKKLKELGATYDLAPPGSVELAEIVRAPAQAAGLVFETDATTGERLDARLLRDADRPDMLPLVQLALSRLFEGCERVGGETRLPLKVYESLGGLKGIVNEAGETALTPFGEVEKARLPRLLRKLAVPAQDQDGTGKGVLTIRAVPLAQAASDDAARRLLDALVTARLLTTSGIDANAQVRLAHQRVLEDWSRAHTIVAESADFYRIRADLEESRRKWEAGKHRGELLLARGLPLAEGESIVGKYGDELAPEVRAYVQTSRTRANRAQMIGWGAAAAFALLAIGAGIAAKLAMAARVQAEQQTQRTKQALATTTEYANTMVYEIGHDPRVAVLPADLLDKILDRAMLGYNQAITLDPDFAAAYLGRGDAYDDQKKYDDAISDYDHAIALDPKNAAGYFGRGYAYDGKGDFDHAIADYNEAITLDPQLVGAYVNRGTLEHANGDFDHAIADDDKAIALDPKHALAFYNRGNAYRDKDDYDRAIADYDQAIILFPNYGAAFFGRGLAYDAKDDYGRAIADYDQAIRFDPKNIGAYANRGWAYSKKGDLDHAIADFDQAIMLDPKSVYAYFGRGITYDNMGDGNHAIADYDQVIALAPSLAPAFLKRGLIYYAKGDRDHAIADFDQAIMLDPKYGDAYNSRGFAYYKKGDLNHAIADYDQAIVLNPEDILAYINRGAAYLDKEDYDRAISNYDRVVVLDPKNANAYNNRGLAYYQKGELDHAISDYDQAIMLDPKHALAYNNRGLAYLKTGRLDIAIADFDAALAIDPKLAPALYGRGLTKLKKGDSSGADADMAAARAIDPVIAAEVARYGIK
jgi:tetratricopeptide (TPR) repeat protein